jgi:hypothetical protein
MAELKTPVSMVKFLGRSHKYSLTSESLKLLNKAYNINLPEIIIT